MSKIFILIFSILIILFHQILIISANDDTYINSSNITYNEKENIVELSDNSKINFKNTNILIDRGIIDYNKNEFEVFGNFYLYEDLNILSGENLKGNTNLDTFTANNVSFIYNDDLKIDTDNLSKDINSIYFYNNFLTPCELDGYFDCPTWSLRVDKTKYNIEEDRFTHFDTFLQIADYKIFYLPYFTHYGVKAPRKKGFLTPTLEFNIDGDLGIIAPYYLPLTNSSEVIFKPTIYYNKDLNFFENYQLNTTFNKKTLGGNSSIEINNIKKEQSSDINNSIKFISKNVINKNKILSSSGFITNSISTSRSINEESITFEDIYLRLENYNFFKINDYLKIELSSVESFDSSRKNSIPISPSLSYFNYNEFRDYYFINDLNFIILKRNESTETNPSESIKFKYKNEIIKTEKFPNFITYNKFILKNSLNDYYFNKNKNLNHNSFKSSLNLSSDISFKNTNRTKPRLKFILPMQLSNTDKTINEESNSITFNYQNQFSENRFFGDDLIDTSPRIVYGLENNIRILNSNIMLNLNQSYEINKKSEFSNRLNQNSKFSDYAIEAQTNYKDIIFKLDLRIDQKNISKKEMNYSMDFKKPINLKINYYESKNNAFKSFSSNTQAIDLIAEKKVNDNISFSYTTNLDLKNNYDPYKSSVRVSFFDECSKLDLIYSNTRFNDNFNTKPEEKISISFYMDYLGFFGYEQSSNLFFFDEKKLNND